VKGYLEQVVGAGIEVTDEEIRVFYEENKTSYPKPPRMHVGQITVASLDDAVRLAELLRQGADLAWLARQNSIDRFKDSGGDRGWLVVSRGADPVQDALFEAEAGDVIGPLGAEGNYFVLRVNARDEQDFYTLEELSATARQGVLQRKYVEALAHYLDRLRERAEIKVDRAALQSLQITGEPAKAGSGPSAGPPGQR